MAKLEAGKYTYYNNKVFKHITIKCYLLFLHLHHFIESLVFFNESVYLVFCGTEICAVQIRLKICAIKYFACKMNQSRMYTQRVNAIVFYLLLFYSTAFGTFCSQPLSHQYSIQC